MSEWSKEPDSKSGALFTGCLGFESLSLRHLFSDSWRGVREAEGARLEIVCRLIPYRGFESHPLRHCGRVPYNKPRKPRQVREEAAVADRLCVAVSPAFLLYFTDFIDYFFNLLNIFNFESYRILTAERALVTVKQFKKSIHVFRNERSAESYRKFALSY